jgi:hypothetical protein
LFTNISFVSGNFPEIPAPIDPIYGYQGIIVITATPI